MSDTWPHALKIWMLLHVTWDVRRHLGHVCANVRLLGTATPCASLL